MQDFADPQAFSTLSCKSLCSSGVQLPGGSRFVRFVIHQSMPVAIASPAIYHPAVAPVMTAVTGNFVAICSAVPKRARHAAGYKLQAV